MLACFLSRSVEVFDASSWSWRSGPDLPVPLASPASLELPSDDDDGPTFLLAGGYLQVAPSSSRSPYSRQLLQFELYRTWFSSIFRPGTYYERWSERPERLAHGTAGCPAFWLPNTWC